MEKVGRNDPCPCGSGKKFKKCCELKTARRSIGSAQIMTGGAGKMSSLFNRRVTAIQAPKKAEEAPPAPSEETPPDEKHLNI
jgi:hypothetical protein